MLKLVYKKYKPLVYKADIYRGREEDKWEVQKIIDYQDINSVKQYKVKWIGYNNTIQELEENLNKAKEKVQEYYC